MILYLDTSALVKLYATEVGSSEVRAAVEDADLVATAAITYAEARSAFARKRRLEEWSQRELTRSTRALQEDWRRLHRIEVTEPLIHRAAELAEELGLRVYDSIHLAAADQLRTVASETLTFACFDSALNEAAERIGLGLLA